jgi:DNA-binding GntR family transcriptional regulator
VRPRSQAEHVAEVLRGRVTEGLHPPGAQLSEENLVRQLGVSRNTLREAFRLLAHDGLLVHEFNRGVFVARLGVADLVDLYSVRKLVEPYVVRSLTPVDVHQLEPLAEAVRVAEGAAREGRWPVAGTANVTFHRSLVALAGSPRLDAIGERLWAELRLLFAVVDFPQELYEPYVPRNRELYEALRKGQFDQAADDLLGYLGDAEAGLRQAFEEQAGRGA